MAGLIGAAGATGLGACADTSEVGGRPVPVPVDPAAAQGAKPNFVVIVSDDHRWDHVSYHPDHPPFLSTPNLDRLASQGMVGRNAFVTTALCSPSRGTFLSGQYARNHGVQNNLTAWNPDTETFFEPLMAAGYDCAFIGKWHMPGQLPDLRGVDTFITFTAEEGQGQYIDCPLLINGVMTERPGTYITQDLTDLALEWIDTRPSGKPYALWLAHKAVHHRFIPPEKFAGALDEADLSDLPEESFAFQSLMDQNIWEGTLGDLRSLYRRYNETLLGLDDQVGRIIDDVDLLSLILWFVTVVAISPEIEARHLGFERPPTQLLGRICQDTSQLTRSSTAGICIDCLMGLVVDDQRWRIELKELRKTRGIEDCGELSRRKVWLDCVPVPNTRQLQIRPATGRLYHDT